MSAADTIRVIEKSLRLNDMLGIEDDQDGVYVCARRVFNQLRALGLLTDEAVFPELPREE